MLDAGDAGAAGDAGDAGEESATTRRAEATVRRTDKMARRGRSYGRRHATGVLCMLLASLFVASVCCKYIVEIVQLAVPAVKVVAMSRK